MSSPGGVMLPAEVGNPRAILSPTVAPTLYAGSTPSGRRLMERIATSGNPLLELDHPLDAASTVVLPSEPSVASLSWALIAQQTGASVWFAEEFLIRGRMRFTQAPIWGPTTPELVGLFERSFSYGMHEVDTLARLTREAEGESPSHAEAFQFEDLVIYETTDEVKLSGSDQSTMQLIADLAKQGSRIAVAGLPEGRESVAATSITGNLHALAGAAKRVHGFGSERLLRLELLGHNVVWHGPSALRSFALYQEESRFRLLSLLRAKTQPIEQIRATLDNPDGWKSYFHSLWHNRA